MEGRNWYCLTFEQQTADMSHDENVNNKELDWIKRQTRNTTEINLLKELLGPQFWFDWLLACYQVHRLLTKKLETSNVDFKKSDLMYAVYSKGARKIKRRTEGELKDKFEKKTNKQNNNMIVLRFAGNTQSALLSCNLHCKRKKKYFLRKMTRLFLIFFFLKKITLILYYVSPHTSHSISYNKPIRNNIW